MSDTRRSPDTAAVKNVGTNWIFMIRDMGTLRGTQRSAVSERVEKLKNENLKTSLAQSDENSVSSLLLGYETGKMRMTRPQG